MLKYYNYDIVFSEIPDEVTLAINISGCPNACRGCHSPWLWKDVGKPLDKPALTELLHTYASDITCICMMGGDNEPEEVERLAEYIRQEDPHLKVAWYSGKSLLPSEIDAGVFGYIKLGGYDESLGGLRSKLTNQRLYKINKNGSKEDITYQFWNK